MGIFTQRNSCEDAAYLTTMRERLYLEFEDPSRVGCGDDVVAGLEVSRVLDVACGVGQALLPLAVGHGAFGVGVDLSEMACRMGSESFASHLPEAPTAFVRGQAESLPFASASFDVVNCALSLPYTNNRKAIAEMSRVLRPGGLLILRIHHALYYTWMLQRGLKSLDFHPIVHAAKVLVAGTVYHLSGRQCRVRWFTETFQTRWLLRRDLEMAGLCIDYELAGSHPQSPTFAISKRS